MVLLGLQPLHFKPGHRWLVWLSGLNAGLQTKGLLVQFPVRVYAWVAGQVPSWGVHEKQPHIDASLPVSPSFPLYLKINKIFLKIWL